MASRDTLPLSYSWPLYEAPLRLPLGHMIAAISETIQLPWSRQVFTALGIGIWQCDLLRDEALIWTAPIYDLFGLPHDEPITRALTVALYQPESRRKMEELRAYAIRHKRGFTIDVQIRRPDGALRWMRLSAMPVIEGGRAVRLVGTKQDVTARYEAEG